MPEYISRDDALLHSEIIRVYSKDYGNIDVVPVEYLADIPAADVQPVRRGKWIGDEVIQCSICNFTLNGNAFERIVRKYFKYCPNCGARMDLGDEKT